MNALLFSVLLAGLLALLVGFENDDAEDASADRDVGADRGEGPGPVGRGGVGGGAA
jgi:hypothetical protein